MSTTATKTYTTTASTPTLRVIKNGFGAEITGLDFADGVTDEAYHFIDDAVKNVTHPWRRCPRYELCPKMTYSTALPLSVKQNWLMRLILSLLACSVTLTM